MLKTNKRRDGAAEGTNEHTHRQRTVAHQSRTPLRGRLRRVLPDCP